MVRRLTTIAGVVLLFLAGPGMTTAKASESDAEHLFRSVIASTDPAGAYAELTPKQKTVLQNGLRASIEVVPDASRVSTGSTTALVAAGGCWSDYEHSNVKGFGITIGEIWTQLNWCGNGTSVTSYNISPKGCIGKLGFSCSSGSAQFRNLGWEVRSIVPYTFKLKDLSSSVCGQIRGGASGLYSTRISCAM